MSTGRTSAGMCPLMGTENQEQILKKSPRQLKKTRSGDFFCKNLDFFYKKTVPPLDKKGYFDA